MASYDFAAGSKVWADVLPSWPDWEHSEGPWFDAVANRDDECAIEAENA